MKGLLAGRRFCGTWLPHCMNAGQVPHMYSTLFTTIDFFGDSTCLIYVEPRRCTWTLLLHKAYRFVFKIEKKVPLIRPVFALRISTGLHEAWRPLAVTPRPATAASFVERLERCSFLRAWSSCCRSRSSGQNQLFLQPSSHLQLQHISPALYTLALHSITSCPRWIYGLSALFHNLKSIKAVAPTCFSSKENNLDSVPRKLDLTSRGPCIGSPISSGPSLVPHSSLYCFHLSFPFIFGAATACSWAVESTHHG